MKIGYRTTLGSRSMAYLDDDGDDGCADIQTGVDKYTEEPIVVRWNEAAGEWVESDETRDLS